MGLSRGVSAANNFCVGVGSPWGRRCQPENTRKKTEGWAAKLSEEEIHKLSLMRRPIVNKPLGIAYGTGELPAMIASSRDYHAYRSQGHVPGDLIPIANANHFTILDELRQPNTSLTRAVIAMAQSQTASPSGLRHATYDDRLKWRGTPASRRE